MEKVFGEIAIGNLVRRGKLFIRALLTFAVTILISCGGGGSGFNFDRSSSIDGGGDGGSSDGGDGGTGGNPATNVLPVADAGEDQNGRELVSVTLDGSSSIDPDGDIVSFSWTQVDNGAPIIAIDGEPGPQVTIDIPDVSAQTSFVFQLTVTDDRGGEHTDEVAINVMDIYCVDDVAGIDDAGSFTTSASGDFVPRCNAQIYIANQILNQVELRNLHTGELISHIQLSSAPTDLEYDASTGTLYAALSGATFLAVIDTNDETVEYIQTRGIVYYVSLGADGDVYLSVGAGSRKTLYRIDSGAVTYGPWPIEGGVIRYNSRNDQIITATYGLSPASIIRYGFDGLGELIELENLRTGGGNGQDLALSNNGRSVALASGGGNGPGYTIYDFSAEDLSVQYGEWNTGAYPSGIAFSPDDSLVVASNHDELIVFDTISHVELMRRSIPSCSYGDLSKVGFSSGGALVFVKQVCGFDDETVIFHYFETPTR